MSGLLDAVTEQLATELEEAVCALAAIAGPAEVLAWPARLAQRAPLMAMMLCAEDDDAVAAQTCIDVMAALWPHGSPETLGEASWWRTPLGQVCARSLGRDDSESVSWSVAAAMLGVHPGTVAQLIHRGTLDRHPDGGALRASVLQRLTRHLK